MTVVRTSGRPDVVSVDGRDDGATAPLPVVTAGALVIDEPPARHVSRSRADVVRLVQAILVFLFGIFLAGVLPQPLIGTERALLDGMRTLPMAVEQAVVIAIQVTAAYLPFVFVGSHLIRRQFRRLGVAVIAAVAAALLMRLLYPLLDTPRAAATLTDLGRQVVRSNAGFPSPTYLAAAVAVVIVEVPWIGRRWRHACWGLIVALCVARLASGISLPRDLVAALAAGWVIGAAALLAFGTNNRRPRGRDVAEAMARAGCPVSVVRWSDFFVYKAQAYECVTTDGRAVFVKVRSRDDRATDVLVRLYQRLRVRDDDGPARVSLHHLAEHEALAVSRAAASGVPTPELVAVADVGFDGVLVAFERKPGERLGTEGATITAAQLEQVWSIVARLRAARIAHRRLSLHSFVELEDGRIVVVDFASSVLAATDTLLAGDVAELVTDTAIHIGVDQAASLAVGALGADDVAAALPRLQPLALSAATRSEIADRLGFLDDLRASIRDATGAPPAPLEELERVKPRTILLVGASAAAFYLLVPQLANISGIWNELRTASIGWVAVGLGLAAMSFVGAALALRGSLVDPPPMIATTRAQLACAFANFASPSQVGGFALNVRFLQKNGTDPPVAGAAVGLDAVAGMVVHLALLAGLLFAADNSAVGEITLPWLKIAIAVAITSLVAAVTLAIPTTRHIVSRRVLPLLRRSAAGIAAVGRRPGRLLSLVGGSLLVTVTYGAALAASVQAVGGGPALVDVMIVYLVGSAIATAAPTPGGLGAVEAAMVAGLISIGVPAATAASAVLVYRGVTFWAPLLPGWLTFGWLQRHNAL